MAKLEDPSVFIQSQNASPLPDQAVTAPGAATQQEGQDLTGRYGAQELARSAQESYGNEAAARAAFYQFAGQAQASQIHSVANQNFANAVNEYTTRVSERLAKTTDDKGNPTYQNIPDDVGAIVDQISNKYGSNIQNPQAAGLFNQAFSTFTAAHSSTVLDQARQQQVGFTKAALQTSIDSLSHVVGSDSFHNYPLYAQQAKALLTQGIEDGSITPIQAVSLQEGLRQKNIDNINNTISKTPGMALAQLTAATPEQVGLTQPEYNQALTLAGQQLVKVQEAQDKDLATQNNLAFEKDQKVHNDDVKSTNDLIENTLAQMKLSDNPDAQGTLTHLNQYLATKTGYTEGEVNAAKAKIANGVAETFKENRGINEVSQAVNNGGNISNFTGEQKDKWFQSQLAPLQQQNAPITDQLVAGINIRKGVDAPIPANTRMMTSALNHGSVDEAFVAASGAVSLYQQGKDPGLTQEDKGKAYLINNMVTLNGMSHEQAISAIRQDENQTPTQIELNRQKLDSATKNLDWDAMARQTGSWYQSLKTDPALQSKFTDIYRGNLVAAHYDEKTAQQITVDQIKSQVGPTNLTKAMSQSSLQEGHFFANAASGVGDALSYSGRVADHPPEMLATGIRNGTDIVKDIMSKDAANYIPKGYTFDNVVYQYKDNNTALPGQQTYLLSLRDSSGKILPLTDSLGRQIKTTISRQMIQDKATGAGEQQFQQRLDEQNQQPNQAQGQAVVDKPSISDMVMTASGLGKLDQAQHEAGKAHKTATNLTVRD